MALCSDLLVIAADAKIGYPPARVWGSPTTSMWAYRLGPQRAKRLLFTGDSLSGAEALEWGLAIEAPPAEQLDERTEALVARIAPDAAQPAADDEAARQPVALRAGPAHDPDARHRVRRDRAPHAARDTRSRASPPARASGPRSANATSRSVTWAARRSRADDLDRCDHAGTRERLLAAAQELIEEGGYGAATVVAIADRAGVAAGTLYRHFTSKEELFVELFRSVCEPRGARDAGGRGCDARRGVGRRTARDGARDVRRARAAQSAAGVGADRRAGRSARRRRTARVPRARTRAGRRGAPGRDRRPRAAASRTSS